MGRIVKAGIASALVIVIAIVLYFFLAIYARGWGLYVPPEKVTNTPEHYVEVDKAELEKYPHVAQAVLNPAKEIRVPFDDEMASQFLTVLWNANRTDYIKFGGDYYRIRAIYAD